MKRSLCIFILVLLPLSIVRADTTACIFDWAESAAPSLISSSVETQNIQYGDFTLRFYNKTKNALIVKNDAQKLYFYDVSKYLAGDAPLQIYEENQIGNISFGIRAYQNEKSAPDNAALDILVDGELVDSVNVEFISSSENFPSWSDTTKVNLKFNYNLDEFSSVSIRSNSGLLEASNVEFLGRETIPSEENLNNKFGEFSDLNWVGSGKTTKYNIPNNSTNISQVGDVHYWEVATSCLAGIKLPSEDTSYKNKNSELITPSRMPIELLNPNAPIGEPQGLAFADFLGNGTIQLMTNPPWGAFGVDGPFWGSKSPIKFWSYDKKIERYIEITDLLIDEVEGCILARKGVVADFNSDGRPDVYLACTGKDQKEWLPDGTFETDSREDSKIVMSTDNGRYEVITLSLDCYCHSGAAGDINGDGYPDIFAPDFIKYAKNDDGDWVYSRGRKAYLLINDGAGNFELSHEGLPEEVFDNRIWSTELVDFDYDGFLDLWFAGTASQYIAFGDGKGNFSDRVISLPSDPKYSEPMDMLYINEKLYVYSIFNDPSKPNYYFGDALTEIDWRTGTSALLYEHEDYYLTDGVCTGLLCNWWVGDNVLGSWVTWITLTQEGIRSIYSDYDFILSSKVSRQ